MIIIRHLLSIQVNVLKISTLRALSTFKVKKKFSVTTEQTYCVHRLKFLYTRVVKLNQ